jgi:membrane protease YdiL (CAAX protease family)
MDAIEPAPSFAALRELPHYLRRPALTAPFGIRKAEAWRQLAQLVLLEILVLLLAVLPLVELWKHAFHLPGPTAFDQIPSQWLLPAILVGAPVGEEMLFRGWLTGRVRTLWLLGCALAAVGLGFASTHGMTPLAAGFAILAVIVAAPLGWFLLRKRGTPRWFTASFPVTFYLVLATFALVHLMNYPSYSLLMLPLVLPQAWIGLMLGYTRMRVGLIGSMLMHFCSNGAVLLFGMLAS